MYLYKLPDANQFMFVKKRSLYHLYLPKDLNSSLPIPEKFYRRYEKHFGAIDQKQFRYSALEQLKIHFLEVFSENKLNLVQKNVLGFFINQFKISRDQYAEALQKVLKETHSFDVQVQLAKYQSLKDQGSFWLLKSLLHIKHQTE